MGCDIYMVLEKKYKDKWIGVDTFRGHQGGMSRGYVWPEVAERNYRRFAALAGVCGDGPKPKGLPIDLSDTTHLLTEQWGEDGHSHSWLSIGEAMKIFADTQYDKSEMAQKYPASHFFGVEEESDEIANHRIVFWFDN